MIIPAMGEIRALHERYAPSQYAFAVVYDHCEIVWRIAEQILESFNGEVDKDLVRAGCLLHDIGVYRLYDSSGNLDHKNYIRHGILGHEILESEGLPETMCRFCSCHTGMGLSKEDVILQQLPLPLADYRAVTPEERLVMYADKFHSKTTPPKFLTADAYAAYVRRYGDDKADAFDLMRRAYGEPDVVALAEMYGQVVEH